MDGTASTRSGVGPLVALLRARRGLTQRQLTRAVGRSPAYISKLELGQLEPSLSAFAAIAIALDMNPTEVWAVIRLAVSVSPELYSRCLQAATEKRPT